MAGRTIYRLPPQSHAPEDWFQDEHHEQLDRETKTPTILPAPQVGRDSNLAIRPDQFFLPNLLQTLTPMSPDQLGHAEENR